MTLTASGEMPAKIAVVIPCYKVKRHVLQVISSIGPEVTAIFVVDDACPESSGRYVAMECRDERVQVVYLEKNVGVGGATLAGYRQALHYGAQVIIKLDGDGQMDPALVPVFARPILEGEADYCKGNRFFSIEDLQQMPLARLVGNSLLSFMAKFSTGYWTIFDPTNGYTAIHGAVAAKLPLDKIQNRYFFESDMLFRLNTLRAAVLDIPMSARYADETSNLRIMSVIPEFLGKHLVNCCKRVFYNYYLRDFNIASIEILVGLASLLFGVVFGARMWAESVATGRTASSGTVMLAALPTLIGIQLILAFLSYDTGNTPRHPIHRRL
jgi:dolichol-phosphate mannosyltransferase